MSPRNLEKDMDDIFCKYLNFFTAKFYYKLIKKYNFKITFKKDFYKNCYSSLRLNTESFLISIKLKNNFMHKYDKKKIQRDYIYDAETYEKEDRDIILSFNKEFKKLINKKKNLLKVYI